MSLFASSGYKSVLVYQNRSKHREDVTCMNCFINQDNTHAWMDFRMRARAQAHDTYTHTHIHICTSRNIHSFVHTYIHTCIHKHIPTYIIRKYTHT